jgi:hypothetical protein
MRLKKKKKENKGDRRVGTEGGNQTDWPSHISTGACYNPVIMHTFIQGEPPDTNADMAIPVVHLVLRATPRVFLNFISKSLSRELFV